MVLKCVIFFVRKNVEEMIKINNVLITIGHNIVKRWGLLLENDMQTPQIEFFVPKDVQCSETDAKTIFDDFFTSSRLTKYSF